MTFKEWQDKKYKNQNQTSDSKPTFEEWSSARTVNQDFLDSFNKDLSSYYKGYEDSYNGVTWGNAADTYTKQEAAYNSLASRVNTLKNYLKVYKNKMKEEDYNSFSSTLADFEKSAPELLKSFKDLSDSYSQFKSEDEWKQAMAYYEQDQKNKEIEAMDAASIKAKLDSIAEGSKIKADYDKQIQSADDFIENYFRTARAHGVSASEAAKNSKLIQEQGQAEIDRLTKERDEKLSSYGDLSEIAYTTADGKNVTWKSLYDRKVFEENFSKQLAEAKADPNYAKLVEEANTMTGSFDYGIFKPGKNKVAAMRNWGDLLSVQGMAGTVKSRYADEAKLALEMNQDEADLYGYILLNVSEAEADKYYDSLLPILEERKYESTKKLWKDIATELPVTSSAISVGANLASGFEYVADKITGDKYNQSASIGSTIRSTVSENVNLEIAGWDAFDFIYNAGMSAADSLVANTVFGGAGGTVLGFSATAAGTNDALERGMSKEQAFWNGLSAGVFEGLFETVSLGNFNALKESFAFGGKEIAKNVVKLMLVNASEETLTEVANIIYDTIINGDFSNYETSVRLYMANGMSEEDAKWNAALDLGAQIAESGASGALMGFGFGAVGSISQNRKYNKPYNMSGKQAKAAFGTGADLVAKGQELGGKAGDLANKYNNHIDKKGSLTTRQMNKLANANVVAQRGHNIAKTKSAVAERLKELGETGDIDKIAEAVTKSFMRQSLGDTVKVSEEKIIDGSTYGRRVANELNPVNVEKGLTSSAWVEKLADDIESPTPTNSTAEEEKSAERKFEASGDGRTYNYKTGEDVVVKGVASVKKGKVMLELENGAKVDADDIRFADEDTAALYSMLSSIGDIHKGMANELIEKFDPKDGMSAAKYARETDLAFMYGTIGYKKGLDRLDLSDLQKDRAYSFGEQYAKNNGRNYNNTSRKPGDVTTKKAAKDGIYYDSHIAESALSETQKATLYGIRFMAKAFSSVELHVYASKMENGKRVAIVNGKNRVAPNGYFQDGNRIYIDINAGNKAEGVGLYALSHEITHFIAENNYEQFRALAEFLLEEYGKQDVDVDALIAKEVAKLKKSYSLDGKELPSEAVLYRKAFEEVVADAMSPMLADPKAYEKLAKLKAENRSLWQTIKDAVKSILDKLQKLIDSYSKLTPSSIAAQEVQRFSKEVYDKLQDLYLKAFVKADANFEAKAKDGFKDSKGEGEAVNSIREIVGESGTNYGLGVYLDSTLLDNLTDAERIEMVKERVKELGGNTFTAYDKAGNPIAITIADHAQWFRNKNGKKKKVNSDLTSFLGKTIKQESVVLADELITTSKFEESTPSNYSHDWLDNYGKNHWEKWNTYVQDKENAVWKATLHIANTQNGEKILYDIVPIKKVEESVTSDKPSTKPTIPQNPSVVKSESDTLLSERDSDTLLEEMYAVRDRLNEITKTKKELEASKEYTNLISAVISATNKNESANALAEYNAWNEKTKYNEIADEIKQLQKKSSDLNRQFKELQENKAREDEKKKIEKSGLSEADYFRKEAVKEFGYTPYFVDAGYLLPNGKMLNFSGEKGKHYGSRGQDHRAIGTIYANVTGGKAMIKFMGEGNIRIMAETPGIDISSSAEPTSEQYTTIKRFVREYAKEKYFAIDLTDQNGNVVGSYSYENNINADRIVNDIKYFFENGSVREQSSVSDFLYSERDVDSISNRDLLANALESTIDTSTEEGKFTLEKLKEYKTHIAELEKLDRDRSKVLKKAFELQYKKGKTAEENAKLKEYWKAARGIAELISEKDRTLLRLEAMKPMKTIIYLEKYKAKQKVRESFNDYRENVNKRQVRKKIQRTVNELNALLLRPTSKKHIKEDLRAPIAEALMALNMDTVGADVRIADIDKRIARENDEAEVARLQAYRDRIKAADEKLSAKLADLRAKYDAIANASDEISSAYYDDISAAIKQLEAKVGNTSLRNMTLEQLEMVYEVVTMLRKTIRDSNKAFVEDQKERIEQMAAAVDDQIFDAAKKDKNGELIQKRSKTSLFFRKTGMHLLKPLTAFRIIGSVTFEKLFRNVQMAEGVWNQDVNESVTFLEKQKEKYGFKSWKMDEEKQFTDKTGKNFTLNVGQIMSLYAYSRRKQAVDHLTTGGFVYDNAVKKVKAADQKDEFGYKIKNLFGYEVTTKNAYGIDENFIKNIGEKLTDDQRAFVDAMQKYLSEDMGAKGNEVSMKLLGVKLFKEKYYLPIRSSEYYMNFKPSDAAEIRLRNSSFSKETTPNASNPIVLYDFIDLWADHVNEMSMYHAMVLPLEDFMRVYNYKDFSDENHPERAIKGTLETAYPGAVGYINKLLRDLNGGIRGETVGAMEWLTTRAKKVAVLGSASVAIQQPSAIIRAMAMINPKYFIGHRANPNDVKGHKRKWEQLEKYSSTAGIKKMGKFDVGMGQSTKKVITGEETAMDKLDNALSLPPAYMDEVTWLSIWEAVKRETHDKNPKLDVSSEEFLKIAGKRFDDVILETQVYDSVFSRSDLMRNKSLAAKWATAFMAEPTTTFNMMVLAYVDSSRAKGFGKVSAWFRPGSAIVGSILFNSVLKAIVMAFRDDDEDESYLESYMEHFSGGVVDNINPLTYIPIVKDIWSICRGYDVNRMDMDMIADLYNAYESFDPESYESWAELAGAISACFGVPLKNVENDISGVIETLWGESESTTKQGVLDAFHKGMGFAEKSDRKQLYDATVDGDTAHLERVKARYENDKAVEAAIRMALRENDPRIVEAAMLGLNGDVNGKIKIIREILDEGKFEQDDIVAAVNAEISSFRTSIATADKYKDDGETDKYKKTVKDLVERYPRAFVEEKLKDKSLEIEEEEESGDENRVTSLYTTDDINVAFDSGDSETALKAIEDIVATKISNNTKDIKDSEKEKDARSSVRSSMTSYWKPLYRAAYQRKDNEETKRIRFILKESGLYGGASDIAETCRNWLKD